MKAMRDAMRGMDAGTVTNMGDRPPATGVMEDRPPATGVMGDRPPAGLTSQQPFRSVRIGGRPSDSPAAMDWSDLGRHVRRRVMNLVALSLTAGGAVSSRTAQSKWPTVYEVNRDEEAFRHGCGSARPEP